MSRQFSIAAVYVVHYGDDYLEYSIESVYDNVDKILISVGLKSWAYMGSKPIDPDFLSFVKKLPDKYPKVELTFGEWERDEEQRNATIDFIRDYDYYFLVDADEIYHPDQLTGLYSFVSDNHSMGAFRVPFVNFWRSFAYTLEESQYSPVQRLFRNSKRRFYFKKSCKSGYRSRAMIDVPKNICVCHHFSYARAANDIKYKIGTWMHADEIGSSWFDDVFLKWPEDRFMTGLFPVRGQEMRWRRAIPFDKNLLPGHLKKHPFYEAEII